MPHSRLPRLLVRARSSQLTLGIPRNPRHLREAELIRLGQSAAAPRFGSNVIVVTQPKGAAEGVPGQLGPLSSSLRSRVGTRSISRLKLPIKDGSLGTTMVLRSPIRPRHCRHDVGGAYRVEAELVPPSTWAHVTIAVTRAQPSSRSTAVAGEQDSASPRARARSCHAGPASALPAPQLAANSTSTRYEPRVNVTGRAI